MDGLADVYILTIVGYFTWNDIIKQMSRDVEKEPQTKTKQKVHFLEAIDGVVGGQFIHVHGSRQS